MNPDFTEHNITELRNHLAALYTLVRETEAEAGRLAWMGLCNGVAYWRSEDGKPERLYANHPAGVDCPNHGAHPTGGRLRKYVPASQEREAIAAIDRWKQHQSTLSKLDHLRATVSSIEQQIARLAREAAWPLMQSREKP